METDYAVLSELGVRKYAHLKLLQIPIRVKNLNFGDSQLQVLMKWGFPMCKFLKKLGNLKHWIFLYKSDFDQLRCYTSCHFIKGRLAFIQSCFPHLDRDMRMKVLSLLMHKYQFTAPADAEEVLLYNCTGEKIIIQNDFCLNMFYFSDDFSFVYFIKQFLQKNDDNKMRLRDEQYQQLKELL